MPPQGTYIPLGSSYGVSTTYAYITYNNWIRYVDANPVKNEKPHPEYTATLVTEEDEDA